MEQRPTTIITSAAYIGAELAAEYGRLPPAFLPHGHQRLFVSQVELLRPLETDIVLSIPDGFKPEPWDEAWLVKHGVKLLPVPEGLSLGESVAHVISVLALAGNIRILHGDTFFLSDLPVGPNLVSVSRTSDEYTWGRLSQQTESQGGGRPTEAVEVLTGWFCIDDAIAFLRALTVTKGDFINALEYYGENAAMSFAVVDDWLDFGHLQTFHRARSQTNTARSFNSLKIADRTVYKKSTNSAKIEAEARWFEALPPPMRLHAPVYMGYDGTGYRLGYEFNPTLHELYVFSRLHPAPWERILSEAFEFLQKCRNYREQATAISENGAIRTLALDKTRARLETWSRNADIDLNREWRFDEKKLPSLSAIAGMTAELIDHSTALPGVMHGDFCFPNVFFDFRQGLVKVIDPRGSVRDGEQTVYGDVRYDLAKLNHSIEGYDLILAGRYDYSEQAAYSVNITFPEFGAATFVPQIAQSFSLDRLSTRSEETIALTVQLFLSMLPLHGDRPDRQKAFLANALRLYSTLDR